jgi:hypothetical protein
MKTEAEFVLDLTDNPHPKMLSGALTARAYWRGYLQAMVDATGCEAKELEDWMDRHQ